MSKVNLTEFDKKVLQALSACVADETIAEVDGDAAFTYCIKTQTYGEVEFIETLLGYLNEQEQSELLYDWMFNLKEKTLVEAITKQLICKSGANYMKDIAVELANHLLEHWIIDVREMLHKHNKLEGNFGARQHADLVATGYSIMQAKVTEHGGVELQGVAPEEFFADKPETK